MSGPMVHGMSFGGAELGRWLDCNPRRPIMPPVNVKADEVPGADGTRFRRASLGDLVINVDVWLKVPAGGDAAEIRHALAAALKTEDPAPLVLPDDPTRYHMAVLDGSSELSRLWDGGTATLTFRACDPIAYGERRRAEVRDSGSVSAGGTYPARPVVTAKPPRGSKWRVEHAGTGEYVEIAASFDGSQTVVVDMGARRCRINGASADPYVTLDSDYFELAPGANEIKLSGGSATLEWDERWL